MVPQQEAWCRRSISQREHRDGADTGRGAWHVPVECTQSRPCVIKHLGNRQGMLTGQDGENRVCALLAEREALREEDLQAQEVRLC